MLPLLRPLERHIGFAVKRLLPAMERQRVGPFIFLDHMGPAQFAADSQEGDVLPHPHIGLATVTYLFSGAMTHRDSLGVVQRIEPGAINLMTAGNGVSHSERIPEDIRQQQMPVEGIQTWLALPEADEDGEPGFAHYAATEIPSWAGEGVLAKVLIGEAWGLRSPVHTASPTLYIDIQLAAGAELQLPASPQERGLYIAKGSPRLDQQPVPTHHVALLDEHSHTLSSRQAARVMLFGGDALSGRRHINWNFVASSRERISKARNAWQSGDFPQVPGETEWIPLPK